MGSRPSGNLAAALAWAAAGLGILIAEPSAAMGASTAKLTPCQVGGAPEIVRCAAVEVPENWRNPSGRRISLNVVVLPKLGPGPEAAPMVWLEGGPGVPGTSSAPLYEDELKFHRLRRAVVLFDQRGTGASAALHCAATETLPPFSDTWQPAAVKACRRELMARADLSAYSTVAAARDVDAIRAALGYDQIDLAGLSYGTYLAQAYMKLYPTRVRSAVLIGTTPLGEKLPLHHAATAEHTLGQVFADCRAEPPCHAAYPHLERDWETLNRRLTATPPTVPSSPGPVLVRQGPFSELIRNRLYTTPGQRSLPRLISLATAGDYALLVGQQTPSMVADALYLSVVCPEGTLRIRPNEIHPATRRTWFGRYRIDQQIAACRIWPTTVPDPVVLSPLVSSVPVLLFSGGHDAVTPTRWSIDVAARLKNSRVVIVPAMAHLPVGLANMTCLDRIMDAFFAAPARDSLDTKCIESMTPPPFQITETKPPI